MNPLIKKKAFPKTKALNTQEKNMVTNYWEILFFLLFFSLNTQIKALNKPIPDSVNVDKSIDSLIDILYFDYKKSVKFLSEINENSRKINYKKGITASYYLKATINLYYHKWYKKAKINIEKAYNMAIANNDSLAIGRCLTTKGDIYLYLDSSKTALINYREAEKIADKCNYKELKGVVNSHIAIFYMGTNALDSSLSYFLKADSIFSQLKNKDRQMFNYISIGELYSIKEQYRKAINCHLKVLNDTCIKNNLIKLDAQLYLSKTYYKMGHYEKAIALLNKLKKHSLEKEIPMYYILSNNTLCQTYEKTKQFKKAYYCRTELKKISDSLHASQQDKEFEELSIFYETKIKEKENIHLKQENKIKTLQINHKQKIIHYSLAILALSIISVIIFIYRYAYLKKVSKKLRESQQLIHKQEKQLIENENEKIKQRLESRERELTSKVMQLFHFNELIGNIKTKIQKVQLNSKYRGRTAMEIKNDLQKVVIELSSYSTDVFWSEFEYYFNEVHPKFTETLCERFPNLTPNEIRLSIFLKLNMRTKEISSITFQSVESINVARARLRKKLNLDNTKVKLSNFLAEIHEEIEV